MKQRPVDRQAAESDIREGGHMNSPAYDTDLPSNDRTPVLAVLTVVTLFAAVTLGLGLTPSTAKAADPALTDPVTVLNSALDNLAVAPKLTSTLKIEGMRLRATMVINKPKRFVHQRTVTPGEVLWTLQTSRVKFERVSSRRCWVKSRSRLDTGDLFRGMKDGISEVEQTTPNTITYTQDDDGSKNRTVMTYDSVTLRPSAFDVKPADADEVGLLGTYRMTFKYRAINRIPRHRPVCKKGSKDEKESAEAIG